MSTQFSGYLTVSSLLKELKELEKKGFGNRLIVVSSDDEGNEYRLLPYQHILSDEENMKRIPSEIQEVKNLQHIFSGAIDMMKKKVSANYKIAVPQYFNGKIQLLLPLCLVDPNVPDLALVVTKNSSGNFYQGHTCLTLEMAYNNARLIAKPDSNWLRFKN